MNSERNCIYTGDIIDYLTKSMKECEENSQHLSDLMVYGRYKDILEYNEIFSYYSSVELHWLICRILLNQIGNRKIMIPYKCTIQEYIDFLYEKNELQFLSIHKRTKLDIAFPRYNLLSRGRIFIPIYPITVGF